MAPATGKPPSEKSAHALCRVTALALVGFSTGAAVMRNSYNRMLPLNARPGPLDVKLGSVNNSRRTAKKPVNFVLHVIVYVSGDGFSPLARIEPSGCLVSVVPPAVAISIGSRTSQG